MAQEFTINSAAIEARLNSLLPSQGGFGAGVDFSASTMIIPTIDVTATATGGTLRQDLQRSVSFNDATVLTAHSATVVAANTPGYWNIRGGIHMTNVTSGTQAFNVVLNDGTTNKFVYALFNAGGGTTVTNIMDFNFNIFLTAGDTCTIITSNKTNFDGYIKQIAALDGTLSIPS